MSLVCDKQGTRLKHTLLGRMWLLGGSRSESKKPPPTAFRAPACWSMPSSPLHAYEALLSRPMLASRRSDLSGERQTATAGTLYLTSYRVLWEPLQDTPAAVFSVPLHAIEQFDGRSGGGGGAVVEAELMLKYGAWPALRLSLDEADYSQALSTLNAA